MKELLFSITKNDLEVELDNDKQAVNYEYIEKLAEHSSVDMTEPNEKEKAMYEALHKMISNRR